MGHDNQWEQLERWFIKQGLPHAIHDYSASTDVLTRATPFLSLVFVLEAMTAFGDRFTGWAQAGVFILALLFLGAAVAGLNRIRGRRPLALPDDIGFLEVALFLFGPAVLPVLFSRDRASGFFLLVLVNIVILSLTYFIVSFGMIPMFRSGARHIVREVGGLGRLMMRSLPLLLLFATFIFLNAEMWQVAHDFTPAFYAISVGLVGAIAFVFLALRIPSETASLAGFDTWAEICKRVDNCDAPLSSGDRVLVDPPQIEPLARVDLLNIGVLLFMRQAVQVVLVALVIGVFYIVFGLFAVREETIVQWTELTPATFDSSVVFERFTLFGSELALTNELLAVSGFIAAFSALQFAVSLITDSTYRDEFYADAANDVRNVLATRALYRHDIQTNQK